jgi:hypothetical protein
MRRFEFEFNLKDFSWFGRNLASWSTRETARKLTWQQHLCSVGMHTTQLCISRYKVNRGSRVKGCNRGVPERRQPLAKNEWTVQWALKEEASGLLGLRTAKPPLWSPPSRFHLKDHIIQRFRSWKKQIYRNASVLIKLYIMYDNLQCHVYSIWHSLVSLANSVIYRSLLEKAKEEQEWKLIVYLAQT